jgi:hypothetical protein
MLQAYKLRGFEVLDWAVYATQDHLFDLSEAKTQHVSMW